MPQIQITQCNIVIVGAMNPAIHHPQWYAAAELLSQESANAALESGSLVMIQQLAQFDAPDFKVSCTPDKWQVATLNAAQRDVICKLSAGTFRKLAETPISSYGINTNYRIEFQSLVELERFFRRFEVALDGLKVEGVNSQCSQIRFDYRLPALEVAEQPRVLRACTVNISWPQRDTYELNVQLNGHHQIDPTSTRYHFDIEPLLNESAVCQKEQDEYVKALVSSFPTEGPE